jgi:hypothetical protein
MLAHGILLDRSAYITPYSAGPTLELTPPS